LLGIGLFEADPEVIAQAAEQRTLFLQSFRKGEQAVISQKMQKKVAAAKACLLNPEKRAEYDISLRLQLRLQPVKSLPVAIPLQNRSTPPPVVTPSPLLKNYLKSPPAQLGNTDENTSPLHAAFVAIKESCDLLLKHLRRHRRLISLIIKLGCAALVVVIILIVFAHGNAIWTFTFDKTAYLSDKILGSSDAKPPTPQPRIRSVPGNSPLNTANSTRKQQSTIPAPVGVEDQSNTGASPPNADSGTTPEAPENTHNSSAPPSTTPPRLEQPVAITSLTLPSGKTFNSRLFRVNLVAVTDLLKDSVKEDQVLFLDNPLGRICAFTEYKQNNLNGIFVAYYDSRLPMTYATYTDGSLDGIIKTWNDRGERVYWCQYAKGVRDGFCCYFKNNSLRVLLEIDHDTVSGVHLCANGQLEKSFSSVEQASADKDAKTLLTEITDLETDLKDSENSFKKSAREESLLMRHERKAAVTTSSRRASLQEHLNQHALEKQVLFNSFWQYKGW
jgi:hypothetical protein